MTFVVFAWSGIERTLPEQDALVVVGHLRARAELRPSAGELADRIEAETRGGTFEQHAQNVTLDEDGFHDLVAALDRLETLWLLTAALRSLQMALRGERRPGEPGYH